MCNIFSILNNKYSDELLKLNFKKGINRGPEYESLININKNLLFGFHRLAINGYTNFENSNQPFDIDNVILICNGEIYNWKELYKRIGLDKQQTDSDCEVIIHLYRMFGIQETLQMLDGVFAFVLYDKEIDEIFVARDLLGIRPLFISSHSVYDSKYKNNVKKVYGFASQLKQLQFTKFDDGKYKVKQFTPGTYSVYRLSSHCSSGEDNDIDYDSNMYIPVLVEEPFLTIDTPVEFNNYSITNSLKLVKTKLEAAVKKRVENTDREICCLLSGGLDSSLIAALVSKYHNGPFSTWSIGLKGSEDLKYAKIVAEHLGTNHHSIELTEEEFLNEIDNVIYQTETYDTTTVRASVGNYLISKKIRELSECKVVFNGDGSDELTGGYMYFHASPNDKEFDLECKRLLKNIHYFDVLRSDRSISCNGLEARTPFLDKDFVKSYLSIPACIRNHTNGQRCEKWLLRSAFNVKYDGVPLLPKEILWRTKEAFSDGVSKMNRSWFTIISEHITNKIYYDAIDCSDASEFANKKMSLKEHEENIEGILTLASLQNNNNTQFKFDKFYFNEPETLEQYYYRLKFNEYFDKADYVIPYFWMPRFVEAKDASARTLDIYKKKMPQEPVKSFSIESET